MVLNAPDDTPFTRQPPIRATAMAMAAFDGQVVWASQWDHGAVPTETLTLTALKVNLPIARRDIAEWARVLGLQVEKVDERRRLLGVKLRVTVTGPEEQIEFFRWNLAGGGLVSQAGNPVDALFNGLIEDGFKALGRWRRSRARRNPRS
jgi:hypothetical protein